MKIFITGGTGFIGTHLVRRLAEARHDLYCLARPTSRTETLRQIGAKVVPGDVTDKQSLTDGMRGCDSVINLANFFEFWAPDRRVYHDVNIVGTRNVMAAAIAAGVSKVIHVSTVAIYGGARWPITEASEVGVRCPSKYAQTKRAGDLAAWEMHRESHLPLVMIYPGGVIGPDDHKATGRYVSNLIRGKMPAQVLTGSVFAWVHVRDVAEAIVLALEKNGNLGEKYLIVAENLTFGDINRMLSELSGARLPGLTMPDSLTFALAHVLTGLADLTKSPPLLDLAIDQIRLMKQGFRADGSKAVRDLGLSYTPIRKALEDEIRSVRGRAVTTR
jgi:dihydroflavonol-4-reductase